MVAPVLENPKFSLVKKFHCQGQRDDSQKVQHVSGLQHEVRHQQGGNSHHPRVVSVKLDVIVEEVDLLEQNYHHQCGDDEFCVESHLDFTYSDTTFTGRRLIRTKVRNER